MGYRKSLYVALLGCAALSFSAQGIAGSHGGSKGPSASMMANTCAGCHGTNGASVGPASPSIAGMSETYLTDTMMAFKSGDRKGTIMNRIAKGYTDDQIEAMSKFYAALPAHMAAQDLDGGAVKKGAKVYKKGCAKCHDDNGGLADDDAGILAGQWLPYMEYTMASFKDGDREMPKKMAKKVNKLSDADLNAVLQFFASQK